MQIHDIAEMLGLQEFYVSGIHKIRDDAGKIKEIHIRIRPINPKQKCPCCGGSDVNKKGKNGHRKIKHLDIAGRGASLIIPNIRLMCNTCGVCYGYTCDLVEGKERYTRAFKAFVYEIAIGSTVEHSAYIAGIPYTTAERFFKEIAQQIAKQTTEQVQNQAYESKKLILGIDDFSIRKGHNYNTGIHDLRGECLIGLAQGRTLSELDEYMINNPLIAELNPHAIVMDLAQSYRSFATKYFPNAIIVADRFHVNRFILDALDSVRKRIQVTLSPKDRATLKRNKNLLRKRNDDLNEEQHKQLEAILAYSNNLNATYRLKEMLIDRYDLSFNYDTALVGYQRWLEYGMALNIPEVNIALKAFCSHQDVITNYHRCRFTNGIVEGRNGKIKALQRRHFFLRNRSFYEALIFIDCNRELAREQFSLFSA